MELKKLKKSFFGFEKNSVFEYISELNRICSEKVDNEREESRALLDGLNQKNAELSDKLICLETENSELKKQLREKEEFIANLTAQIENRKNAPDEKSVEAEVADILTEAKRFAKTLREKAVKENDELRRENQKNNEAERQRIAVYSAEISKIKSMIDAVLSEANTGLEAAQVRIALLKNGTGE